MLVLVASLLAMDVASYFVLHHRLKLGELRENGRESRKFLDGQRLVLSNVEVIRSNQNYAACLISSCTFGSALLLPGKR